MRSLVDVRMTVVFTAVLAACSGQAAPVVPERPVTPVTPVTSASPPPIYVTQDAPLPVVIGGACSERDPCGPGLQCDATQPRGACTAVCEGAGTPCSDGGVCVEYPLGRSCRLACRTNDDCRADEGYACDPVWKGCVLANAPTIAPLACPAPTGLGRDTAFGASLELANATEPAATLVDTGGVVVIAEPPNMAALDTSRVDHAAARFEKSSTTFTTGSYGPALARDGSTLYAAAANRGKIEVSISKDRGVTWSPPTTISGDDCTKDRDCIAPAIAIGGKQRVLYVAYTAGGGIRVRSSKDGVAWTDAVTAAPGTRASLAVGVDGTLHLVSLRGAVGGSYGSGDHDILLTSSADGRRFTRPQLVNRSGERIPYYFGTPRIEIDSARRWIYIAYTRGGRDGKWDIALAATNGKVWSRSKFGDDTGCIATYAAPQLALDPTSGALHVAWYDSRGSRYAHGVCADGLRFCRQLGRINDRPFDGMSLSRRDVTSVSESTALLVDNQRRLLHAVWAQPVGGETRIFHAKAKLPLR